MLDVPLYSSQITRLYVGYVKLRHPGVDTNAVLEAADLDSVMVWDPGSWLTQQQVDRFHAAMREATADAGLARAAGRHSVYSAAGSTVRQFVLGLLSPHALYSRIDANAAKLTRGTDVRSRRLGPRAWEITFTPRPGVEEKPFQCDNRMGFVEAVPEFFGYGFGHLEHPECWHRGDEACVYRVSWSASGTSYWRWARNIALAAAVLGPLGLVTVVPLAWAAVIALAMLLLAAVLAMRVISLDASYLEDTVRRQGTAASQLMEETTSRYDAAMLLQYVGRAATERVGTKELLHTANEAMARRLSFERAALYLVDDTHAQLDFVGGYGWPADDQPPQRVSTDSEHLAARVFRARVSRMADVEEASAKGHLRSRLAVPIRHEQEVMGVIVAEKVQSRELPTDGERAVLQALASQVALGLHKVQVDEQLQRAGRLEALGTLAGGVAHDFNNLLTGIQGNASLMLDDLDHDHPHALLLGEIRDYARSGASLTSQLLGAARRGKVEVRPLDVLELVHHTAQLFGRTRKQIRVEVHGEGQHPVLGDPAQLEQVLLNIFLNADQAMAGGGRLVIRVERHRPEGSDPERVCISVTDSGTGMDGETLARAFDPFFTTRARGRGTGLGLASAYGIVQNHGGDLIARSQPGSGSTFEILLPLADVAVPEPMAVVAPRRGRARVLLVDDEASVRRVGRRALERLGYEVDVAEGGLQALEMFEVGGHDLVVLDLIMPELTGAQTFDRLRQVDPGIKVLLSSGYSIDDEAAEILARGANGFLQKPFGMNQLGVKVSEVLRQG